MGKNNISFILHKPQLSENIGACARGMKNFDFKKLILINPRPIFPTDKILATSVGAKELINKAKVYNSLEQSIQKIDILIERIKMNHLDSWVLIRDFGLNFVIQSIKEDLNEFKVIFYWEYFHRILARIIGLFFLIPLIFFYMSKK